MSAVLTAPQDLVNAALVHLGVKKRVGNLYDGSDESKRALDIYGQARDAKLREFEWGFAEGNAILNLLKLAPVGGYNQANPWSPANPVLPWIFEYAYPSDMLKLRSLRSQITPVPNFDPTPAVYRIANDSIAGISQKVILCNTYQAVAVYTRQVTDPTLWEPSFNDALIEDLARRLAAGFVGLDGEKLEGQADVGQTQNAEMRLG